MSDWITTEEASQISGYSIQYVQRLLREEKIVGEKKGGAYWVNRDSLVAYIAASQRSKDKRHGARKKPKSDS